MARRPDFGSLHYGAGWWGDGIFSAIFGRRGDHDANRWTLSVRNRFHQYQRLIPDRSRHDIVDGALPAASELASFFGGWISRRLHHIFEFRVGNVESRQGWGALAGIAECSRQRNAWICRGVVR